jgi:steroid 5-alpha reductase family enzyme
VSPLGALAGIWALAALMMLAGWVWQQRRRNAGIVDVLWASGLAGSAVLCALLGQGAPAPRLLLALTGGAWGVRLAWHLWRRVGREPEDGRYAYLRQGWGDHGARWLALFQFQAVLVALFSLPYVIVAGNTSTRPACLTLACLIWIGSVLGESVADRQLASFRASPAHRGRTCREGLWRYSRHPNYFFEALQWLTYPLLGVGAPYWALTWAGPILMFLFVRFVSGIPFTEAQAIRTRGEDYRDYQRRTSMLIPWPPRGSD